MNIVICCKWVLDAGGFVASPAGVDTSRAQSVLSDYDRNAIEAGMRLAREGDHVRVLTFGGPTVARSMKDALSRGPGEGWCVSDPIAEVADGAATATVLAAALRRMGDVDLVLCGEGSADVYAHEVGPRLATALDLPVVTNASKLSVADGSVRVGRTVDGVVETIEARLPAVVAVLPEAAPAPIPGLKSILAAGRRPVTELTLDELGLDRAALAPRAALVSTAANTVERKRVVIAEGSPAERAARLVDLLVAEGVMK